MWAMYLGGYVVRYGLNLGGKSCSTCAVSCRDMEPRSYREYDLTHLFQLIFIAEHIITLMSLL